MIVAWRTCCPTWVTISDVRILSALPISAIMSGSQWTEYTSPTIGSMTEKGNRTSSTLLVMNLVLSAVHEDCVRVH